MRKTILSAAVLFLASGLVAAQQDATPQQQNPTTQNSAPMAAPSPATTTQHVGGGSIGTPEQAQQQPSSTDVGSPTDTNEQLFRGCLSGSKDNYTLTDQQTNQTYRLHSDKDINEHVGDLVEVRGTIKQESTDRPSDVATGGMQEIDVADIKTVSKGCSAGQGAASTSSEQSSQSASTEQQPATGTEPSAATTEPSASASTEQTAPSTSAEQQTEPSTSAESQSATTPEAPAETAQAQPGTQLPQSGQPPEEQGTQQPAQPSTGVAAGNEQTVRGCISGTKDNLMISDEQTGQSFRLVSSQDLSAHVGHEVEITGTVQANSNVAAGGAQDLQVSDLKMIAESCPSGPGAAANQPATTSESAATAAAPATSAESQTAEPSTSAESQTAEPSTSAESQAAQPSESAAAQGETQPVTGNEAASSQAATESAPAATGVESANAQNPNAEQGAALPQTGSELPLLLLMGFGSLGAGLVSRFRR